jgi:hypothetical protein
MISLKQFVKDMFHGVEDELTQKQIEDFLKQFGYTTWSNWMREHDESSTIDYMEQVLDDDRVRAEFAEFCEKVGVKLSKLDMYSELAYYVIRAIRSGSLKPITGK